MNIILPVSAGEAIDKYSILTIKKKEIKDETKLKSIIEEMDVIYPQIKDIIHEHNYHYNCLLHINKEIWDLSEKVRDFNLSKEYRDTLFLETFYKNDARFRIKNKINKLSSSFLNEQKSYPGNIITFNSMLKYDDYINKNHYIRYISLCYDYVMLVVIDELYDNIKKLFDNDPHIIVKNDINNFDNNLTDIIEPIPNLLNTFNFSYEKTKNYICGGRLGDFIHALYVIMCQYETTNVKGNIYITDQLQYGGDGFSTTLQQTYEELYPIVIKQSYIKSFEIYNNQVIDVNLNHFRYSNKLYNASWLEIMSSTFGVTLLEKPWIQVDTDDKYKNIILIHQSSNTSRKLNKFLPILENIIKNNNCLFITCNKSEYEAFKFKHLIPLELKSTLYEMYVAINSCKMFIGNQSSPLAMAYSLFKPLICESTEGVFYTRKHYKDNYWVTHNENNIPNIKNNLHDIVICIFACATVDKYKQQILKINDTWGKYAENKGIKVLYFLGEEPTDLTDDKYIYLKGVNNDYLSASYKQNLGLKYVHENYNYKFVYCCGTDTYINIEKLISYLKNFNENDKLYIGGGYGFNGDILYRIIGDRTLYYHSGGAGFILSKTSLQYLYPMFFNMVNTWERVCIDNNVSYLTVACDTCISYYLQINNFMLINDITRNDDLFFACNYKGYHGDKICCGEKVNIKKIIACHYMSLEDFDNFTTILENNNYYC